MNGSGLTNLPIELGVLLVLVVNDILVHPSLHQENVIFLDLNLSDFFRLYSTFFVLYYTF